MDVGESVTVDVTAAAAAAAAARPCRRADTQLFVWRLDFELLID